MGKRVFLIVLDSAGVGWEPDADRFGDVGSDTFGTCIRSGRLHVPNHGTDGPLSDRGHLV